MGTLATVTAVGPDGAAARQAVEAGYARLDDVNRLMSDYREDSEVSKLNRLGAGVGIGLSRETFECLRVAAKISAASGGAFDVTCRPLIMLWRAAAKRGTLPTDEELRQVREVVGWEKLEMADEQQAVRKRVAGLEVDLGGIAKGYALDLAAEAMRKAGAQSALIDVGGDVLAVGRQADGNPWRIGVKHPFREGLIVRLSLVDRAVATSGVQQRFFEIDGKRHSHIIDPRTGWPAAEAPSVTVIARDGITADAWATVFSVLSVAEGKALLAKDGAPDVEVMWITGSAAEPVIDRSEGFRRYVIE